MRETLVQCVAGGQEMRRGFFKIIVCIVVAISVFFSHSLIAQAADDLGYFDGSMTFVGLSGLTCSYVSAIGTQVTNPTLYKTASGDLLLGYFVAEFEQGHVYNGYLQFDIPVSYAASATGASYFRISFGSVYQSGDGWYSFTRSAFNSSSESGSASVTAFIGFNNLVISATANYRIPVYLHVDSFSMGTNQNADTFLSLYPSRTSDITNVLYDDLIAGDDAGGDSVQNYIYNQTQIIEKNDQAAMQQQQQIADQQAEQSRQQHEDLVSGYDNSANNNMLQDKDNQLQQMESLQDQAFVNANTGVTDFQSNYDTSVFQQLAPSFMMVSLWFNELWSGMGSFSVILSISLVLCVAGYILKLRR